jgi:hypothetical protein
LDASVERCRSAKCAGTRGGIIQTGATPVMAVTAVAQSEMKIAVGERPYARKQIQHADSLIWRIFSFPSGSMRTTSATSASS